MTTPKSFHDATISTENFTEFIISNPVHIVTYFSVYSITVLQYYSIAVLQYYSIAVLQYCSITVLQYCSITLCICNLNVKIPNLSLS